MSAKGKDSPEVVVDDEFRALCPPLSENERDLLEKSIVAEGCRDPLVLWEGILIDGHNRFEICSRLGVEYRTFIIKLQDRAAVRLWILKNQMGRRNLSFIQASYLRGQYYRLVRQPARGKRQKRVGKQPSTESVLAQLFGVCPSTIRNDTWVADAIDKLTPEARAFVFDPDFAARKQHIIDLSQLGERSQNHVVNVIRTEKVKSLATAVLKLRGKAVPGDHCVRCKRCGARLAPGIITCLSCDLSERDVIHKLEDVDDEEEEFADSSWRERLEELHKIKREGSEVVYFSKSLRSFLEANEIHRNSPEHKELARLAKVLSEKVGRKKFGHLIGSDALA